MAEKHNEISLQTRQNFIDAFWQLYEKKGINKIKVQEVCDMAGYHRSTFYHYFSDVYEILEYIEDLIISEIVQISYDGFINCSSKDAAKRFAEIYEKNKKYLLLLADERKGSRFSVKMRDVLMPIYKKIVFFSADEKENECIQEYHLCGGIAAIMQYFRGENKLPLDEILNITIEICKQGNWPMKEL